MVGSPDYALGNPRTQEPYTRKEPFDTWNYSQYASHPQAARKSGVSSFLGLLSSKRIAEMDIEAARQDLTTIRPVLLQLLLLFC